MYKRQELKKIGKSVFIIEHQVELVDLFDREMRMVRKGDSVLQVVPV